METFKKEFIEALYEVLAKTKWEEDGLKALQNLPQFIDNIELDVDNGKIEFQDIGGSVCYEIAIRKTFAGRPQ